MTKMKISMAKESISLSLAHTNKKQMLIISLGSCLLKAFQFHFDSAIDCSFHKILLCFEPLLALNMWVTVNVSRIIAAPELRGRV